MNKMSEKTRLIMFDYDGVLINSNHLPKLYFDELSANLGTKKFKSVEECKEYLETDAMHSLRRLGVTAPEQIEIAINLLRRQDNLWKNLELFHGVKEMLKELKQRGYILAIISNNHKDTITHDLKKNNVLQYFEHIFDITTGKKPDTEQIIQCLNVTNTLPEEAVLVDDMDGGIIAAKKAKLKKVIGVSYGFQPVKRLHLADVIVEYPMQIIDVIE